MSVSNFVRSTFLSSLVVCSINTFNSSRKAVFVCCITFLSYLAFVSASVESLVQIIWIPSRPTYTQNCTILARETDSIHYTSNEIEITLIVETKDKCYHCPRFMNISTGWLVRYTFLFCNPSICIWKKRRVLNALDLNFAWCRFYTHQGRKNDDLQSQGRQRFLRLFPHLFLPTPQISLTGFKQYFSAITTMLNVLES